MDDFNFDKITNETKSSIKNFIDFHLKVCRFVLHKQNFILF
jgi:hypothetical protein